MKKKLMLALVLALLVAAILVGPALAADGHGVSATGLGRCGGPGMESMGPGTGAPVAIWVPSVAGSHINGGASGLIFASVP